MRTNLDQLITQLTRENLELGQEIRYVQWDCNLTDTQKRHKLAVMGRAYQYNEDRIVELVEQKWDTTSKYYCNDTTCKAVADMLPGYPRCAGCGNDKPDGCFIDGHGI